ncbi:MAG: Ig-like domain-containing protein [Chitinophagales bacterium]
MKNQTLLHTSSFLLVFLLFFSNNTTAQIKFEKTTSPKSTIPEKGIKRNIEAVNDTLVIRSDKAQLYNIMTNDHRPKGEKILHFKLISEPKGKAEIEFDRVDKLRYQANYEGDGPDSFEYEVCDSKKNCDRATVVIYKCPKNNPKLPRVKTEIIQKNGELNFDYPGQIIKVWKKPETGTCEISDDKSKLTFRSDKDFMGEVRFNYDVYEDPGPYCGDHYIEGKNMIVEVVPVDGENTPPVAVKDEITIIGRTKTEISPLENDYDAENTLKQKVEKVSNPKMGKIKRTPRVIKYTPTAYGTETLTYKICDYNGACSEGQIVIHVKKK